MRAGIALGSNLGDRLANLRRARTAVMELPHVSPPFKASRIYDTDPVGSAPDAGAYLNAVIEIEYDGQPMELLDQLHGVEAGMGRPSKRPRNASRIIDLDILYAGNLVLSNEEVVIPHPRLHLRRFVLTPLHDIAADLIVPGQSLSVAELLERVHDPASVVRFTDNWDP